MRICSSDDKVENGKSTSSCVDGARQDASAMHVHTPWCLKLGDCWAERSSNNSKLAQRDFYNQIYAP